MLPQHNMGHCNERYLTINYLAFPRISLSQAEEEPGKLGMIVRNERLKRAILAALADPELQKILDTVMFQSKSVNDIIHETKISHTTAYRKIRWLVEEGLLFIDKIDISEDGKKSSLFRTILRTFTVKYDYNNIIIEAEQNIDTLKKVTERFFSLD